MHMDVDIDMDKDMEMDKDTIFCFGLNKNNRNLICFGSVSCLFRETERKAAYNQNEAVSM